MLAYFSTSFGAYHRCLDIPPFLWRCIPTALNSRQQADTAPVDADFLRPVKSVFHLGSGVSSSLYLGRESIHYTRPARERCMGRSCWRCSSSRPFFYFLSEVNYEN